MAQRSHACSWWMPGFVFDVECYSVQLGKPATPMRMGLHDSTHRAIAALTNGQAWRQNGQPGIYSCEHHHSHYASTALVRTKASTAYESESCWRLSNVALSSSTVEGSNRPHRATSAGQGGHLRPAQQPHQSSSRSWRTYILRCDEERKV